jgi:Trk K+ transport system NAD-binding subunit
MRLIVVGAGSAARALLRLIGERWEITVVDVDPRRLEEIAAVRPVETYLGDGSDPDVLEGAGLSKAAAVVAASDDDEVNLAVCRSVAAGGLVATAVAADPELLGEYRDLDVPAFSRDRLAARRVVSVLEARRESSASFASGLVEGLEFRVVADSPMRGKALRDLPTDRWLVVSVLRGDRLIIPHGGTVLQAGDLVTVIGREEHYAEIVRAFTAGVARFPGDYGSSVGVVVEDESDLVGPVAEAVALAETSAAESVTLVYPRREDPATPSRAWDLVERVTRTDRDLPVRTEGVRHSARRELLRWPFDGMVGLIVVPARAGRGPIGRHRVSTVCRAADRRSRPVLFARGATRYDEIVVPARDTPAGRAAARAAIDLGAHTGIALTAVAVVPPLFIAGDEAREQAARAAARLQEEAAVHGVPVRRVIEQGNAVRVIERMLDHRSLLVMGLGRHPPSTLLPGVLGHLVRRSAGSVLVVPRVR